MGVQEAMSAEIAAVRAHTEAQRGGRKQMVNGINVAPYAGFRMPGIDRTTMFSAPEKMLKAPKASSTYLWRAPDDAVTKNLVGRGVIRAVCMEEVDPESPYATVSSKRLLTSIGPKEVVRTPMGLGLFEVPSAEAASDLDKGLLPGDHWEKKYMSDLAEQSDTWESDIESLSKSSQSGRVKVNEQLTAADTKRETI